MGVKNGNKKFFYYQYKNRHVAKNLIEALEQAQRYLVKDYNASQCK